MRTIYGILNGDGRVVYVGSTSRTPKYRVHQHWRSRFTVNIAVAQWLRTLDTEPTFVVLEDQVQASSSEIRETFWIGHFGLENLLNGRVGGFNGGPISEKTREKISKAHTGKKASDETRRKMSEKRAGKPQTPAHRTAMEQVFQAEDKTPSFCLCGSGPFKGFRALQIHKSRCRNSAYPDRLVD